jgi:hypothetical protein
MAAGRFFADFLDEPDVPVNAGLKVPSFRRSQIPQLRTDFV